MAATSQDGDKNIPRANKSNPTALEALREYFKEWSPKKENKESLGHNKQL